MADQPSRPLADDEIAAFHTDGVVCVRDVVPAAWVDRIARAIDRIVDAPTDYGQIVSMQDRGFTGDLFMWLGDADFRAVVFDSPLGELAAQVLGSSEVRFFYDQLFVKEPGALVPTPWHHDLTFWPIQGDDVCSIWLPVDPVTRETSGLEYVRGSHRWPQRFKAVTPDYSDYMIDPALDDPPDIDANRDRYDLLSWPMEPGDLLIFHPLVVHGSSANRSAATRRRALATRWVGDDVVFAPRPATMPLPFATTMQGGDPLHDDHFPLVFPLVATR